MRKYAPLYTKATDTWSVIFQDLGEEEWYTYLPNVGGESNARDVARALNRSDDY